MLNRTWTRLWITRKNSLMTISNNLEKETETMPSKSINWVLRLISRARKAPNMLQKSGLSSTISLRLLLVLTTSIECLTIRPSLLRTRRLLWLMRRVNLWNLNRSKLTTKKNWSICVHWMNVIGLRTQISRGELTRRTWGMLSWRDWSRTTRPRSEWERIK